eukprot:SAG31_NODE_19975_length_587_cov_0.870902_2_plen_47_part_00
MADQAIAFYEAEAFTEDELHKATAVLAEIEQTCGHEQSFTPIPRTE